ncbi:Imm5 family immunity protein [Cellulomonas sp. P5_C5]
MPVVPPPVTAAIADAVASIGPDGELPAAARGRVHRAVDAAARELHPDAGRYVRTTLALVCAYATLGQARSRPDLFADAEGVADVVTAALNGDADDDELEDLTESLTARVEDGLGSGQIEPRALYALLACVAAAGTLLYDTPLEDLAAEPAEADPADWDAAFLSSLAFTGGALWEGVGDPAERRRFWLWYLETALPYAWDPDHPMLPYPPVSP